MLMRGFWPWYWENNTTGIWKCTLAEDWNREIFASVLILLGPFYSLMLWGNFKTGWILMSRIISLLTRGESIFKCRSVKNMGQK